MMKAIIMAGGEGSRLLPLTAGMPKPLTKLCNRPAVDYILDLLARCGCKEAIFTLRYRGEMIERRFESGKYKGIRLSFIYEDEPLGTAGCVRNAAGHIEEDFLVISGDALCDFDLRGAFNFQKQKMAVVTIVSKRVNDPREYGLVIDRGGRITGFSEKPSYLSCTTDYANTGIYIMNPSVLKLIPEGKMWDFAKDVFPEMIKQGMPLYNYKADGYWCDIGCLETYRESQKDMLNCLVKCELSGKKLADGLYSETSVHEIFDMANNTKIIPPCYIGKNVKIGDGSVIESTVLCDNVTIGKNVRLYGSVILDGAYIAGGSSVENAIICKNVKICRSGIVGENSVIGENTVIGEKTELKPGVKIWNDKKIEPFSVISGDIRRGIPGKNGTSVEIGDHGIEGITNIEIDMEAAVKIGSAVSNLVGTGGGVLISCDGGAAGEAIKRAVTAGMSACGKDVTDCGNSSLPVLIYLSRVTNSDIVLKIGSNNKTNITILNKSGLSLTRTQERQFEAGLRRREYKTAEWDKFGAKRNFYNGEELYKYSLYGLTGLKSEYNIFVSCKNEKILEYASDIFDKISSHSSETLVVEINEDGTEAEMSLSRGEGQIKLNHERLILLACISRFLGGHDAALPAAFPVAAELLAKRHGKEIKRYYLCPNNNSDREARELSARQPFLRDGVHLCLLVLNFIASERKKSKNRFGLVEAAAMLPEFSREQRIVKISVPPQHILADICEDNSGIGEGLMINRGRDKILLRPSKKGDSMHLFAESASAETAAALCDDIEKRIKSYSETFAPNA
ncbi:MAG: NTP transferase domain-containing protein [Eubacterium sp.]|jgi:mannose-1-phosphate guanylyltransferase/phosphomannomutase|nr:NTP transferase domain-containing protein [Eubacterium sp.]